MQDLSNFDSISQLTSYMRQMKSDFGFLVGKELRIYYDGYLNKHPDPLWIEKIDFNKDTPKGLSFVKYFAKSNFDNAEFREYLNQKIRSFNKKSEVEKLVNILISDKTKEKFSSYLKTEYSDFSEDVLVTALKKVTFNISRVSNSNSEMSKKLSTQKFVIKNKIPTKTARKSHTIPKNIEKPDLSKISINFENRAKVTLAQIYSVLFYMKKGFDFPSSVKFSLDLFPDVKDYQTIADKCGRRFAESIPVFEKWFTSGEMLHNLSRKYSLSNFEYNVFKEILGD